MRELAAIGLLRQECHCSGAGCGYCKAVREIEAGRVVMHAGMVEKLCADNERLERQLRALARGICGRTHEPTHLGEPCPYCRAVDAESRIAEARAIFELFDRGEIYDTDALAALRDLFSRESLVGTGEKA